MPFYSRYSINEIAKRILIEILPETIFIFGRRIYQKFIWAFCKMRYFCYYGHADFFSDLNIEINTSCNRRCPYCPNSLYERGLIKNEKLMEEDVFKKVINELAEIDFNGRISPQFFGEPLLDGRLVRFMEYARNKLPKARLVIISNGDYLTKEIFIRLLDAGVNHFLLTQHSEKMTSNMENLFVFVNQFPAYRKMVKFLHFDENTPLFNRGGAVSPKAQLNIPRCLYPENPVVIDYAGDVVLCCNDYQKSVIFGNVKTARLKGIWFSDRYRSMRKQLRKQNFTLPICKKCVGTQ